VRTRILLLALAAALLAPSAADACTIAARPAAERVAAVDAAIYGRVLSRVLVAAAPPGRIDGTYRYRIRVVRTYKGRPGRSVQVVGSADSGTCGLGILTVGRHVGLLLDGSTRPWEVSTRSLISRAELEQAAREPRRRRG
jgi:hypothetical protein